MFLLGLILCYNALMPFLTFSELQLGFASAEEESAQAPDLLIEAYRSRSCNSSATEGRYFLVLGHKGAGKSAVGEHLRLKSHDDPLQFFTLALLGDFPFTQFKKIIPGDTEPEAKYPTAWAWILLIKLLDSFSKDVGAESSSSPKFPESARYPEAPWSSSVPELKHIVQTSSKNSFRVNLASVLDGNYEAQYEDRSLQLPFFVQRLQEICFSFRSDSRHLFIIDGLDDILTRRDIQYQSLAALLFEVGHLNREFRRNGTPAKILVLCRTDIFERLHTNKNKLRQDSAFNLDWYKNTREPSDSLLVKLVNLRARLQDPSIHDIFERFFPSVCKPLIVEFLLELT